MDILFPLMGGLGIFLLGMKNMSDGMQAVAGAGLRRLVANVTDNRFLAVTVGCFVTCLVQSSSVTTVMVVGFVNGGIMALHQAVGVIMGANIGTTITGWILVLKIGKYGLPLLGVAAFVFLFSKNDRWRYIALTVMGIGMVFFGLELMKDACESLKDQAWFNEWFRRFNGNTFVGRYMCMLVGCVLTMVVQSSSATLGITIGLATTGAIPFESAAALVLGENVGTTITAFLASLGATTNARRAAYFHVVFNLIGVLWISLIFPWYVEFIPWLVGVDVSSAAVAAGDGTHHVEAAIAATHSVFNICNTLAFLPFVTYSVNLLLRIVPDQRHKETHHLTNLDIRMLETPVIAIEQSKREVLRMGEGCEKMLAWLKELSRSRDPDPTLVRKLFHREEVLDSIEHEIVEFLTVLLAGRVPRDVLDEGRCQLRMADEYESISDYVARIMKYHLKLKERGFYLTDEQLDELDLLHDEVAQHTRLVTEAYSDGRRDVMTKAHSLGDSIKHRVKSLRKAHLDDATKQQIPPNVMLAYTSTLNSYRRVRDHVLNLAEAMVGEK